MADNVLGSPARGEAVVVVCPDAPKPKQPSRVERSVSPSVRRDLFGAIPEPEPVTEYRVDLCADCGNVPHDGNVHKCFNLPCGAGPGCECSDCKNACSIHDLLVCEDCWEESSCIPQRKCVGCGKWHCEDDVTLTHTENGEELCCDACRHPCPSCDDPHAANQLEEPHSCGLRGCLFSGERLCRECERVCFVHLSNKEAFAKLESATLTLPMTAAEAEAFDIHTPSFQTMSLVPGCVEMHLEASQRDPQYMTRLKPYTRLREYWVQVGAESTRTRVLAWELPDRALALKRPADNSNPQKKPRFQ